MVIVQRKKLVWILARLALATVVVVSGLAIGCAKWNPEKGASRSFRVPKGRMAPDSVSLELAVAQLNDKDQELEQLWRQVDQQKMPLHTRKILDKNGIRVAVVPSQIPESLHELLEPEGIDPELLNDFQLQMFEKGLLKPAKKMIVHRKIQSQAGHSKQLPVSNIYPAMSWSVHGSSGQFAGAGESVRGIFDIQTFANGDGSVRVIITPEIHHGKPTTQIGVVDRSFLFQQQQTKTPLKDLMIDLELVPGETILIAATPDLAGVGGLFFQVPAADANGEFATDSGNQQWDGFLASSRRLDQQRFVLIRLVHTQRDDLFGLRSGNENLISTPPE